MHVTLSYLRAFLEVARTGNFSRAAKKLSVSQPALSASIRQLEHALNLKLFERTTRRLTLTEEGAELLPTVTRLLDDFDTALDDARAIAERRRGRVSLAVLPSVAATLMPTVVTRFSQDYPGIRMHLRDANTSEVWRMVARHEIDFGLAGRYEGSPELEFMPILSDRFGLMAPDDHPLARATGPLPWAALADYHVIGLAADTGIKPLLAGRTELPQNVLAPNHEVSNTSTVMTLVEAGLGVTALPAFAAMRERYPRLVFRELINPTITRDIGFVQRRGAALSPAAESIRTLILESLAALPMGPYIYIKDSY